MVCSTIYAIREGGVLVPLRGLTYIVAQLVMSEKVVIFWDYENCTLPALELSYTIVNNIRELVHQYGHVTTFKAYLQCSEQPSMESIALRSELKDVADKMLMVDMIAHVIDNPAPTTIVLISGDHDFTYTVSILSLRRYDVVLLTPRTTHNGLKAQASAVYVWPDCFLPMLALSPPHFRTSPVKLSCSDPQNSKTASRTQPESVRCPTSASMQSVHSDAALGRFVEGQALMLQGDDCSGSRPPVSEVKSSVNVDCVSVSERFDESDGNADSRESFATSINSPSHSKQHTPPLTSWKDSNRQPRPPTTVNELDTNAHDTSSGLPALDPNVFASEPALEHVTPSGEEGGSGDGAAWQTYSPAVKKPLRHIPDEFKPLVKVLKRKLVEGVVQLESSLLGQLLSKEGVPLRLDYTKLVASRGIVTKTSEGTDGHSYIALHSAFRRSATAIA
ncbi:hypothetical protein V8D89_015836 [Ganoderma adspersum]